jgi:hypothetical protein
MVAEPTGLTRLTLVERMFAVPWPPQGRPAPALSAGSPRPGTQATALESDSGSCKQTRFPAARLAASISRSGLLGARELAPDGIEVIGLLDQCLRWPLAPRGPDEIPAVHVDRARVRA